MGWLNTLGGESSMMYEYGTEELSGADHSPQRVTWATLLEQAVLSDGTEITNFNFTKGDDGWDPLPDLIANDVVGIKKVIPETSVMVHAHGNQIFVSKVKSDTFVRVYSLNGVLMKTMKIYGDKDFFFTDGFWIITIDAADGRKAVKVFLH